MTSKKQADLHKPDEPAADDYVTGSGAPAITERTLEQRAGRTLTELSIDGNKGFKAFDANACSIYVAKGSDVITWSIQTMNPAMLPDLCTVTGQLAELSQERVN